MAEDSNSEGDLWNDDELTTPAESNDLRALSKVLQSARPGDELVFAFVAAAEKITTDYGEAARFEVRPLESDVPLQDGDGETVETGEEFDEEAVAWVTSSSRLLAAMKPFAPVGGKVLRITIDGVDMDADYTVEEVEGDD